MSPWCSHAFLQKMFVSISSGSCDADFQLEYTELWERRGSCLQRQQPPQRATHWSVARDCSLLGPPVASTGMLMRRAALARDLRGFMDGARCGGGAASGSDARLGRALGMGSGLPDTLLGAPWVALGAEGAGMADCLRRGALDGAAVGLSHGATPAGFRVFQQHGKVLSAGHCVKSDSVKVMPKMLMPMMQGVVRAVHRAERLYYVE